MKFLKNMGLVENDGNITLDIQMKINEEEGLNPEKIINILNKLLRLLPNNPWADKHKYMLKLKAKTLGNNIDQLEKVLCSRRQRGPGCKDYNRFLVEAKQNGGIMADTLQTLNREAIQKLEKLKPNNRRRR